MVVDPATVHALAKDNRLLKAAAAKGKETRQATDLTLFANASYSGHADYLEQMVRSPAGPHKMHAHAVH